ncbi:P-loop containing nucleoside triphosphate hydrolase protein [Desarmillaria tabescens]|uniref:RNA helicase n=1 Tax=Armillaria tabescens TaxID=1929756 RepID=A0AA39K280_ARMTA|nr:P-loop containing nucleoside triphosphate hydrolase protein [Desarmillaria tabescens]KAK0452100.1 P-loop containing nucleoside triphosphate hydrolase protein [Desarmillaria tabescens]
MVAVCPKILSAGHCDDDSCRLRHDVLLVCNPCRKTFLTQQNLDAHLISKRHLAVASRAPGMSYCRACDRTMAGSGWDSHVRGSRHLRAAERRGVSPDVQPELPEEVEGYTFCPSCNMHIPNDVWNIHINGRRHKAWTRYTKFTSVLEEAEENKHGVIVEGNLDFDIVNPSVAGSGISAHLTISTTVPHARLSVAVRLASSKHRSAFSPFTITPLGTLQLKYRQPLELTVAGCQNFPGRADDRVELAFEDQQLNTQFIICRPIHIIVGDPEAHRALQPKTPYVARKRTARHPETKILPKYDIPKNLHATLATGSVPEVVRRLREMFLPPTIEGASYGRHFRHLIWAEEFKSSQDLEYYDIPNSKLTGNGRYYHLEVPGLAEKRPSVLVGDNILVRRSDAPEGHWYSGCVHFVHKAEVGLCFYYSFKATSTDRFLVRFKLNRYPLRRQHQALETAFAPARLLLPTEQHVLAPSGASPWRPFNKLIDTNPQQRQAVDCILRQPGGSVPFIIFGPPGTGKTVTMVEAIRQIHASNPKARILACAPSNSAADLITSRLMMLGEDALFRFYAPSRPKQAVPLELKPFTYVNDEGNFSVPILARVRQFRVIVSTCVSASVFFGIGIPRGHFTHIFIDEAGQATEPEAMIAIKTMADNTTNVILSGDPKQLGPIIRSPVARDLGLEISYIERLMQRDMYDEEDQDDSHPVVKLIQNFRSHPAILKFPDERFYKGELQPCADPKVITSFIGSKHLEAKKFPIVFYAMAGKDAREASSPSFFNIDEVLDVKKTVEELRSDKKLYITDDDIGVIAPYHAQVLKIRNTLRGRYDGIKVGSVEEFQGQERKVIIISTVRSSRESVEFDLRHTLGFVASPRRFNVAITRAKALVVVIGDPTVLSLDPLWRSFLNYIYKNGGWRGLPISWDPDADVDESGGYDRAIREAAEEDMNDFGRQLEAMTLAAVGEDEDVVDRPWTRHDG